jgi:hypothetical protein
MVDEYTGSDEAGGVIFCILCGIAVSFAEC